MTWLQHHSTSERYAAEAEIALRRGDMPLARELYARAADVEEQAIGAIEPSKSRTLGVSAVSAVSLRYKANQLAEAEALACKWLAFPVLPAFSSDELRLLLQAIWNERIREHANVRFAPGQVMIAVKGGEVVSGGSPARLDRGKGANGSIALLPYRRTHPGSTSPQARWADKGHPGELSAVAFPDGPWELSVRGGSAGAEAARLL